MWTCRGRTSRACWSGPSTSEDADETPPPADFVVTNSCQYVGDLTDEGATFKLTVKLNVLRKKGWKRIPLLPAPLAATSRSLPQGVFLNTNGPAYAPLD